ncbi:MAG: lipoprotein insertase outer membrane protein LolB [Marinobacter sp.]|nr:lipoprotein insertase outer membrane protein LolB [Marinobacter sp.]
MKLVRTTLALTLVLALAACATAPMTPLPDGLTEQPPADWSQRQSALMQFQYWQLKGKLAVHQPSDSGTAVINRWSQHADRYQLSLSSSFLGLGHTELSGVPGYIELTLSNGETYRSADPQALIRSATGWALPIDSLVWWIRGLPEPGTDYRLLFDTTGKLAAIRQQGWEIRYNRWQPFVDDTPALPALITARKGDKRVKLAVTSWQALGNGKP